MCEPYVGSSWCVMPSGECKFVNACPAPPAEGRNPKIKIVKFQKEFETHEYVVDDNCSMRCYDKRSHLADGFRCTPKVSDELWDRYKTEETGLYRR